LGDIWKVRRTGTGRQGGISQISFQAGGRREFKVWIRLAQRKLCCRRKHKDDAVATEGHGGDLLVERNIGGNGSGGYIMAGGRHGWLGISEGKTWIICRAPVPPVGRWSWLR